MAEISLKKYKYAITEMKLGIRLEPETAQPHNLLGVIYRQKKMYKEAISEFKLSLKFDPGYIQTYYEFGVLYDEIVLPKMAEEMFRKALEIDPKFIQAKMTLARLMAKAGRCTEAGASAGELKKLDVGSDIIDLIMDPCNVFK